MTDDAELAARFDRVLSALRAVIATATALDPAFEETKKGVGGAFADAIFSRSQAHMAFEDETPTIDALVISLKDNRYKDPSWPTDGADDAQMLRSVWHFIHDTIGAGKPFTPDDLSVMRNLYAALERAREKLKTRDAPSEVLTVNDKPLDPTPEEAENVAKAIEADMALDELPELFKPIKTSWIKATMLAEIRNPTKPESAIKTLSDYRTRKGQFKLNKSDHGIDKNGRKWRHDKSLHVWYLRKSLPDADKKLIKEFSKKQLRS